MRDMSSTSLLTQAEWLRALVQDQKSAAELFGRSEAEQKRLGYFHTLREICQQPWTWLRTCDRMLAFREELQQTLKGIESLVLTGSGSSEYAGACVRLPLQNDLKICTEAISGGTLLMYGGKVLPPGRPGVVVSVARSGDSPESSGVVELLLEKEQEVRHIVLTCNEDGRLAQKWRNHKKVQVITLASETNDKSVVMTSSFTNLLLAGRFLGMLNRPEEYRSLCGALGTIVKDLIGSKLDRLAKIAATRFRRAVFLGSGSRFAASREAALKMLESTAGRIPVLCETFLGLRHGPMSYVHEDTLIVAQLSNDPRWRAYELDLLRELDRKKLGLLKLVVGDIPPDVIREGDEAIEVRGLSAVGDEDSAAIYAVVGQLLAFFRCREEGLQPDSPSEGGIIHRVVEKFPLHASS
jgi:tagatose-6-phosphate ketose/aldose isomerase